MSTNKSFSTETAQRYARALFEISHENLELDIVENNLKEFLNLYNSSLEFVNFIKNPTMSNNNQLKAVDIIATKFNFTTSLKNFLFLLIKKKRIFYLEKIIKSFLVLCSQKRGELKASLVSSKDLSKTELSNISLAFSESMGSKINFDYSVDEELIGGIKIQLGSLMVDTSIKNRLKKYKQLMLEN